MRMSMKCICVYDRTISTYFTHKRSDPYFSCVYISLFPIYQYVHFYADRKTQTQIQTYTQSQFSLSRNMLI